MATIDTILVATDLSECAERAENRAAMLAYDHKPRTIELMTVEETGLLDVLAQLLGSTVEATRASVSTRAMELLQSRAARMQDLHGIESSCAIRFGYPAAEIAARADEIGADLIVIGAQGRNFLSDLFLGDTADKLVHLCKRPLLVVKNEPRKTYRSILAPVDFSEDARQAVALVLKIAPNAGITLLHAFEVGFEGHMQYASVSREVIDNFRIKAREKARLELNELVSDLNLGDRCLDRVITFGRPEKVVREYAEKSSPDLIVMGKHGRSRLAEMIIGSVTRDTVDQTASDVLIVPAAVSAK